MTKEGFQPSDEGGVVEIKKIPLAVRVAMLRRRVKHNNSHKAYHPRRRVAISHDL